MNSFDTGLPNRRKSIRAKCLDCAGGGWSDVANCQFEGDCDLWPYRLGKGKQNAKERNKAIRQYCMWCCLDQINEVRLCPATDCPLWPYRFAKVQQPKIGGEPWTDTE
jgi:hypothetical protein